MPSAIQFTDVGRADGYEGKGVFIEVSWGDRHYAVEIDLLRGHS